MRLRVLPGRYAVCRLDPRQAVPAFGEGGVVSVTRTAEELSVVCAEAAAPEGARTETGWRCLAVQGPIPFTLTGVLSSLLAPLAAAKIGIFAISTYDTDYILLKEAQLAPALAALREAGHEIGD